MIVWHVPVRERPRSGLWRPLRPKGVAALAVVCAAVLAGCGSASSSESGAKRLTPATLQLDATLQGFMLPFVWALDKGYYRDEGIDLKIVEGTDATTTAKVVGAGRATFGEADSATVALTRSQGAKLTVVSSYLQRTQGAVISRTSTGIRSPQDVRGKTVGGTAGSSSLALFLAFLAKNGIPQSAVQIQNIASAEAKAPAVAHGRVDAITGFLSSECIEAKQLASEPVDCLPFADYGVKALGIGAFVRDDTLKDKPDLVRGFLAATAKGWHEAVEHPAEASQIGVEHFPSADEKLLKEKLIATKSLIHTDASAGKPIGWMARSDWVGTLDYLHRFHDMANPEPPSTYYTNEYVPKTG